MAITTENVKSSMLTLPGKNYTNIYYATTVILDNHYAVTVGLLGFFPSMASFFFQQFVQRNGPSHGLDAGEKKGPEFIDKPSPGGWSIWQTAQRKIPEFLLSGKSLPSLHFKKI